jgi:hypothetical protein
VKRLLLAVVVLGLAACAERPQEPVAGAQGAKRYQGKPDTPAWGNGERAAWTGRIKERQLAQHEDRRIYQQ